jgi:hypothetical protein
MMVDLLEVPRALASNADCQIEHFDLYMFLSYERDQFCKCTMTIADIAGGSAI